MKKTAVIAGLIAAFAAGTQAGMVHQHNKTGEKLQEVSPLLASIVSNIITRVYNGEIASSEELTETLKNELDFMKIIMK
jgi:fructose-specific phosphotransferase system IIC component